jgi:tetrapyrrole methylase family protein/MazG family protein
MREGRGRRTAAAEGAAGNHAAGGEAWLQGTKRLLDVVARLRGPGGCPWDREQTLASLKPFLIEEAYELIDAVDSGDPDKHAEELGDVLLQVALQARIRDEKKQGGFDHIAGMLADKLIRRHPHVFADALARTPAEVLRHWDAIKAAEAGEASRPRRVDHGIPRGLPALEKARKVQGRAAREGFDWDKVCDVAAKVEEELREARRHLRGPDRKALAEEIGDLLFAVVNLARFTGVNAEEALEGAVKKFVRRYTIVQDRIHRSGRRMKECTLRQLDAEWNEVKKAERRPTRKRHSRSG